MGDPEIRGPEQAGQEQTGQGGGGALLCLDVVPMRGSPFGDWRGGVSKPAWREEMLTGCWRSRSCHEPVRRTREYFPHHIDSPCSSGRGGRGIGEREGGGTMQWADWQSRFGETGLRHRTTFGSRRHRGIVSLPHISVLHSTRLLLLVRTALSSLFPVCVAYRTRPPPDRILPGSPARITIRKRQGGMDP